jgi:hypothetical protein
MGQFYSSILNVEDTHAALILPNFAKTVPKKTSHQIRSEISFFFKKTMTGSVRSRLQHIFVPVPVPGNRYRKCWSRIMMRLRP